MVAIGSCGGNNPTHSSESQKPCLPKAVVVVLALLSVIVLSGAVGGGVYLFMHQVVPAAAAGGGTLVVTGIISLIIVRSCTKKKTPEIVEETQAPSTQRPTVTVVPPPVKATLPMSQPQTQPRSPSPQQSQETVWIRSTSWQQFAQAPFTISQKAQFFDASSGQAIPLLQVYKRLLLATPAGHTHYQTILGLFSDTFYAEAQLAMTMGTPDQRFGEQLISDLSCLDVGALDYLTTQIKLNESNSPPELKQFCVDIKKMIENITSCEKRELPANDLTPLFYNWSSKILLQRAIKQKLAKHETFGIAIDSGLCFYHAVAQALSAVLQREITMEMIADRIKQYLVNHEQAVQGTFTQKSNKMGALAHQASYADFKSNIEKLAQGETESQAWADQEIECTILSEIYGVSFEVYEAQHGTRAKNFVRDDDENMDLNDLPTFSDVEESDVEEEGGDEEGSETDTTDYGILTTGKVDVEMVEALEAEIRTYSTSYVAPGIKENAPVVKVALFSRHFVPILPQVNQVSI